ncbi:MAG: Rieske 2Fe-2S domain-containing protein [Anaerolineales bacterium]|nr:Rieske 2Fe-2S domain-containing protein [Anaerolineales bacterium]
MTQPYIVAKVADVPEGAHLIVEVRGRSLGIFNVRGRYYALPNACFHQNGPLCAGAVSGTVTAGPETNWQRAWGREGEIIVCPWHALEFDIPSGQCLAYPNRKLPTWEVQIHGDELAVLM